VAAGGAAVRDGFHVRVGAGDEVRVGDGDLPGEGDTVADTVVVAVTVTGGGAAGTDGAPAGLAVFCVRSPSGVSRKASSGASATPRAAEARAYRRRDGGQAGTAGGGRAAARRWRSGRVEDEQQARVEPRGALVGGPLGGQPRGEQQQPVPPRPDGIAPLGRLAGRPNNFMARALRIGR